MSATRDAWRRWSSKVEIFENGKRVKFDANHRAYALAMAAYYSGWNRAWAEPEGKSDDVRF